MLMRTLLALIAGALIAPSLAPFSIPLLAIAPPALLYIVSHNLSGRRAAWIGWCFGLGFFGSGVSWVFVSIYEHSQTPLAIAVVLTTLFVAALALLFSLQLYLWRRFFSARLIAVSFVGLWLLFEWGRSWLFTGFPWLYLGNAALDTPFQHLLPVGGVWLGSLAILITAMALAGVLLHRKLLALAFLPLPFLLGSLSEHSWTTQLEEPIEVALVQPNIPQQIKWNPSFRTEILDKYARLSRPHQDTELMLWPETAIPALFRNVATPLATLLNDLDSNGVTLISGLPSLEPDASHPKGYRIHNSLATLTTGSGVYHKQRLVPFGEYLPFEQHLRGVLDFFNLPMSSFSLPEGKQPLLTIRNHRISAAICYEIAYPELVRKSAKESALLLTVSNDTWFGHSIAPAQHMQIARARALENSRWLIRGTNNGLTGLISPQGEIVKQLPPFQKGVLRGQVYASVGETPFQQFGSWPVLAIALFAALSGVGRRRGRSGEITQSDPV